MKHYIYLLVLMVVFAGCDQVVFDDAQPPRSKALTDIPLNLRGVWLDQDNDTLHVFKSYFRYTSESFSTADPVFLSDSAVLKSYQGKYFFSRIIKLQDGQYWLSYILDPVEPGKHLDLYFMDPDNVVKLAKLQEITSKLRDIEVGETKYYLFSPKRKHYKKIISDTIFSKMISFRRVAAAQQ